MPSSRHRPASRPGRPPAPACYLNLVLPVLAAALLPSRLAAFDFTLSIGSQPVDEPATGDAADAPSGTAPPAAAPANAAPESSRWDLELLDGVRFGGIIGASFDNELSYQTRSAVDPVLDGDVGVGGTSWALGARWTLNAHHWVVDAHGRHLDLQDDSAICPKLIACWRTEERKRSPSIWRGMPADGGWYYGGEIDVLVHEIAFAVQATWEEEHHQKSPSFTLAYGLGF